jgi:hypothetical protein
LTRTFTSPCFGSEPKARVTTELKLVDQVGEESNGNNNDQNGTNDVVMEHMEDEFEEHDEHDEEHEKLDDELQLATKKTKASLAHTQIKLGVVIKGH